MDSISIEEIKKDPEKLLAFLKEVSPVLFVIAKFNQKYLGDIEYGHISIVEHIQKGKIVRAEATPVVSVLIDA